MKYLILIALLITACSSSGSKRRISLVHTQLGTGHLNDRNFPLAFRELFTAVELDPKNAIAHNQLGLTYIVSDRLEVAETHIQKALDLNPKYTDAKVNLAYLKIEKKEYNEALRLLKSASEDLTYMQQHKLLSLEGRANFYLNHYKKASNLLRESILKSRKYCPAHRFFGPALSMQEDFARAAKAIEHAIAICEKEKYDDLYYYGALSYFHTGDYTKSLAKLKELKAVKPNSSYNEEARKLKEVIEEKL